ncbi:MAG: hypothetical protein PHR35_05330, partial [Kiritimatiellae bacterium]|nr:hypothetical protein [Kiritimatiellia bacterium]
LQDPLNGSGGTDLTGTSPESRGGVGPAAWGGSTNYKADGTVTPPGWNSGCIWLPFVPYTGHIYRVSAVMDTTLGGDGYWMTLGFAASQGLPDSWNFADGGFGTYGTVLLPNSRGPGTGSTYLGPAMAGGATHDSPTGPVKFVTILDATDPSSANWTLKFYVNKALVRGPVAFGSAVTINYVGFSNLRDGGGTIGDFLLEIPPPPQGTLIAIR